MHVADGDCTCGEIMASGPGLMLGYLNNPTATAEAFDTDGWLSTGDIGYEKHGKIYIVDRKKE